MMIHCTEEHGTVDRLRLRCSSTVDRILEIRQPHSMWTVARCALGLYYDGHLGHNTHTYRQSAWQDHISHPALRTADILCRRER